MGFDTNEPDGRVGSESYFSTSFRPAQQPRTKGVGPARPLVLIVNDIPEQFQFTSVLLRKAGYEVALVSDGASAYQTAIGRRPDLIICNLAMTSFDGLALIRRILAHSELTSTPVLLLNANPNQASKSDVNNPASDPINLAVQVANLMECKRLQDRAETELLESRRRLAESQQIYRSVFDQNPDAVFSIDRYGQVMTANPRGLLLSGRSHEELVGTSIRSIFSPQDQQHVKETIEAALLGQTQSFECVLNSQQGTSVELTFKVVPVVIDDEVKGLFAVGRDVTAERQAVTERRRLEGTLHESEERLEQVMSNIDDVMWLFSPDYSEALYVSPAYQTVWGRSCESLYGAPLTFLDAIHPTDRERIETEIRSTDTGFDLEYRIIKPDGDVRWIWDRRVPIRNADRRVVRIAGIAEDITPRKLSDERLKQREAQLAEAQRLAHIGSFEWDPVTGVSTWSDELYRIVGLEPQFAQVTLEFVGKHLPSSARAVLGPIFQTALNDDEPFVCESQLRRIDETLRSVEIRGQRHVAADDKRLTVIGTVQDITESKMAVEALRKSEEQLLQSQKMEAIGRLAGGIAHDFNNLLTVIYGYSELALRNLDKESQLYQKIFEIQNAGSRAASLTKQLLAFSRRQMLQPQVINLNTIVNDMANMLRRLIGEHISLKTLLDPELGSVKADPGQIEQVILNLAVNARDAMPEGGKLTIETQNTRLDYTYLDQTQPVVPGDYVVISVSDSGLGFDDETKARIFEPFFTTKPSGKGTGLGLSTVYGIVKQSDGYIWAYSEVDHGTCFKVYLPHVDQSATAPKRELSTDELSGTETILLVEDEEMLRELTRHMLESCGYKVLEAATGVAALELCKTFDEAIDLLLTDVVMPEMSGKTVSTACTQIRPELKVLYMSGYTDDAIVHHGVLDEGINFLQKPFTLDSLSRKVREVIQQR